MHSLARDWHALVIALAVRGAREKLLTRRRLVACQDDTLCHVFHNKCLKLGEWAGHVGERKDGGAVDGNLEAACARLLLVDLHRGSREACLHESLKFGGPRLKRASALARLNLDHAATISRRGLSFGKDSRLFHRLRGRLLGLLIDGLLRRHDRCLLGTILVASRKDLADTAPIYMDLNRDFSIPLNIAT